jgi:hypothetical protein
VPDGTPTGAYRLIVGIYRAANGQRLEARSGLLDLQRSDAFEVKTVELR